MLIGSVLLDTVGEEKRDAMVEGGDIGGGGTIAEDDRGGVSSLFDTEAARKQEKK